MTLKQKIEQMLDALRAQGSIDTPLGWNIEVVRLDELSIALEELCQTR